MKEKNPSEGSFILELKLEIALWGGLHLWEQGTSQAPAPHRR